MNWPSEILGLSQSTVETLAEIILSFKPLIYSMSYRSGSPSMSDIEAFSNAYRELMDKAQQAKSVPDNMSLEVLNSLYSEFKGNP